MRRLVVLLLACSLATSGCSLISGESRLDKDKALIRSLFYDESQSYQRSPDEWVEFVIAHNYPGAFDEQALRGCAAQYDFWETYSAVPDLNSVVADPTWVGPPARDGGSDWRFEGQKPEGRTYSVNVDMAVQGQSESSTIHVTILDEKAYFYKPFCA